MKSPHYFIVKPIGSERYSNKSVSGLIVNVSLEDHAYTQRLAEVISTPIDYEGDVEEGDVIVVHHNTFRIQYNNQGTPLESKYHIKDDLFYIEIPLAYMVIKKNTNEKIALAPFCFVEPNYKIDKWEGYKEDEQYATLKYLNKYMPSLGFKEGDLVGLKKDSEYEFKVYEETLYMINQNRILFTL